MLVCDEIESETGLWMACPGEALATILPHARLVPLHRYLAAAVRPDTDHNLQIGKIKRTTTPRGARRNARLHRLKALPAGAGETAERKQFEAKRGRPYLYIVVLPKGGVFLELEPRGGRGGAGGAELVVEVVRQHLRRGRGSGGAAVPGRVRRRIGGAGGGGEGGEI
jgi:hypothetical protein